MIRLALVDDHPAILDAIAARVAVLGDMAVVGRAGDVDTAIAMVEAAALDVVVCDLQLPGGGGLRLLDHLLGRPAAGRPAVLVVSAFDTPSLVRAAFDRGAAGYLPKSVDVDVIVDAVRTVAGGGTAFSTEALRSIRVAPRRPTAREIEVVGLVVGGATNGEIGLRLGLSEKTVESHLRRLFDRYGVMSRTELALLGVREQWVDDPGVDAGGRG